MLPSGPLALPARCRGEWGADPPGLRTCLLFQTWAMLGPGSLPGSPANALKHFSEQGAALHLGETEARGGWHLRRALGQILLGSDGAADTQHWCWAYLESQVIQDGALELPMLSLASIYLEVFGGPW